MIEDVKDSDLIEKVEEASSKPGEVKKIDLELFRFDTLVFGTVFYTDKELISRDGRSRTLGSKNGYSVNSQQYPTISGSVLNVWGNTANRNEDTIYNRFESARNAENFCRNIKEIIAEINSK